LSWTKLPYRTDNTGFYKAPRGKLPYVDDDGIVVADSTFIRWHIEKKHGVDFDQGLVRCRPAGWAFEKMAEDHLYWVAVYERWMDDENFRKGPIVFFQRVPAPIRPFARVGVGCTRNFLC
jgi:hypothetical protein